MSAQTHRTAARNRTGNSDDPPNIARTAEERILPHIKGGLLLDVFAGIHAPISAAADKQGLSRFAAFDLEANSEHDILDAACFELLMRISWSGIVSLITLAPPCKEYSRLKLRPGGPKALRTPTCIHGVPGLSLEEASRVAQSREIHRRSRELFKAVATQGGVAVFEQPPSSMAWLEPENFQCLKAFHGHLAWVDACQHGMSFAKSWCFASNNPCIQHVAARCNHPQKHASIAGVRSTSGQFLSTLTAEYPATLAASLVTHCAFKVRRDPLAHELQKPGIHPNRLKICDGAGMRSTADHSIPQPRHPLGAVARAWLRWATTNNLISKILAHVSSDTPEPPLSAQESEEAALIAFAAVNLPAPTSLAPDSGQPYRCHCCALASASNSFHCSPKVCPHKPYPHSLCG